MYIDPYEYDWSTPRGWRCPGCGRCFAPSQMECPYCGDNSRPYTTNKVEIGDEGWIRDYFKRSSSPSDYISDLIKTISLED